MKLQSTSRRRSGDFEVTVTRKKLLKNKTYTFYFSLEGSMVTFSDEKGKCLAPKDVIDLAMFKLKKDYGVTCINNILH